MLSKVAIGVSAFLMIWSSLCFGVCAQELIEASGPSVDELEEAEVLIQRFEENKKQVERFAVAMRTQYLYEPITSDLQEFSSEDWYIYCEDKNKKLRRSDQIMSRLAKDSQGNNITLNLTPFGVILSDNSNQRVVLGNEIRDEKDLTQLSEADKSTLRPHKCFDPWDLVLDGTDVMRPVQTGKNSRRGIYFNVAGVKAVEKFGDLTIIRFGSQFEIEYVVTFSKRCGDMPVAVELEYNLEHFKGTHWASRLDWRAREGVWYPMEILVVRKKGNPSNPTAKVTNHISAHWLLNNEFPESVFCPEADNCISTFELRDKVLSLSKFSVE